MPTSPLFSPLTVGSLCLPNRVVMAPMTRLRAEIDGTPTQIMADYYAQRAGAGLILSEGIWPESSGQSEWRVPGLETSDHVAGWATVTDAVHRAGGRIVAQLMHGGRKGHPRARFDGSLPAGPSTVVDGDHVRTADGTKIAPACPREMTSADIRGAIDGFAQAAENAMRAGFDGVEVHGANSYLVHQFLADNTNLRTDEYGGSVDRRTRFAHEVVAAVAEAVGASRTGIRLSPGNPQSGIVEADPAPTYRRLLERLAPLGIAYLHLTDNDEYAALRDLRPRWGGVLIANVGENREPTSRTAAELVLARGQADAVSFGRGFVSNPDLPARLLHDLPLREINRSSLYTPGPVGYTDYATVDLSAARTATL